MYVLHFSRKICLRAETLVGARRHRRILPPPDPSRPSMSLVGTQNPLQIDSIKTIFLGSQKKFLQSCLHESDKAQRRTDIEVKQNSESPPHVQMTLTETHNPGRDPSLLSSHLSAKAPGGRERGVTATECETEDTTSSV